jgi:hypothetical protein
MKKIILGCFCLLILTISCKKNKVGDENTSYMTTTAGTTWNYQTLDNAASTTTPYTLTSTSTDSTINARVYHVFTHTDASGSTSEYYNVSGSDYYQYTSLSAQLPPLELKYLVDNIATGTTWTQPLAVSQTQSGVTLNFNATLKYSIEEKGGSVSVAGKTYNNVIKVRTEITNPSISSSLPVPLTIEPITQNITTYFAQKYGTVKRDFQLKVDINALGTVQNIINQNTTTNLLSSNIQ